MTLRLYYTDSYLTTFDARVVDSNVEVRDATATAVRRALAAYPEGKIVVYLVKNP